MAQLIIIYWRDIPAQVIVKAGRKAAKKQLSERFEQAIDRCAMQAGASDTDAYLAEWRKSDPADIGENDMEQAAQDKAAELEVEYDKLRLKALIDNDGFNPAA